jgi:hypothetical protein
MPVHRKLAMDESDGENGSEYTGEGSDDEDEEDDADSAAGAAISDSERADVLEGNPDAWGPGSPQRGTRQRSWFCLILSRAARVRRVQLAAPPTLGGARAGRKLSIRIHSRVAHPWLIE